MRRKFICLIGMIPSLAAAGEGGPLQWSPDGRWVAYTVRTDLGSPYPNPGWIFGNAAVPFFGPERDDSAARRAGTWRVYAAEAGTGSTVVLAGSPERLSSPCWSPDGRHLAFARVAGQSPGPVRLEVVVQDEPAQSRVLCSRAVVGGVAPGVETTEFAPAWSPDGRYLAVPDGENLTGLSVLWADSGRVIKSVDAAAAPAWSPDGSKLAFLRREKPASLHVLETGFGPTKVLAELGEVYASPVWSRDGRSVLVVARRLVERRRGPVQRFPTLSIDLVRVEADSGSVETVANLGTEPAENDAPPRSVRFAADKDGDDLYWSVDADDQPAVVVRYQPATQTTVDRSPALDAAVRVTGLAVAPGVKTLALRFGWPGSGATAAFWDVETRVLRPIAGDETSRRDWARLLIMTAGQLTRQLSPGTVAGVPVDPPTILPAGVESGSNDEILSRLRRLGRIGRSLHERPEGVAAVDDPAADAFWREARLYFDALRGDYPAALATLETLATDVFGPDEQLRLLALRAQLYLGSGDLGRARNTLDYLRTLDDLKTLRFETTPAGFVLTPQPPPANGWARYLSARLETLSKTVPREDDDADSLAARRLLMPPLARPIPFGRLPDGVFIAPQPAVPPAPRPDGEAPPRFRFRPRGMAPLAPRGGPVVPRGTGPR